jgi:hypothetical protein
MSLDIRGRLIQVLPLQSGTSKSGNGWSKQEFVIETEEQFPKKVCFTLFGDKVSLLNGLSSGDQIDVSFNLESREFNGKWYSNINAWKVNPVVSQENQSPSFTADDIPPPSDPGESEPPYNDLPF